MSGLFAFLMQSVLFTPAMVRPYVKESLQRLNFNAIVNKFGMFFLHDLDMSKELCLPEVVEQDDLDVLRALGLNPRQAQLAATAPGWQHGDNNGSDDIAYPLGRTLTWNELKTALSEQPWVILHQWSWPSELDKFRDAQSGSPEHLASSLFQLFTAQVWAALNASYKSDAALRRIETVENAVEFWSLDSIHKYLKAYSLIPCNSMVRGRAAGPRVPSFEERASLYFVKPNKELAKLWAYLAQVPGYIAQYRQAGDIDQLDLALRTLFSFCQCLPNSKLDNAGGIWEVKHSRVIMLTNPHYYKLESVGLRTKQRHTTRNTRSAPAHAAKKHFRASLLELHGISRDVAINTLKFNELVKNTAAAREKMRSKNRSAKVKNFRQPPKKKQSSMPNRNDEERGSSRDEDERLEEDVVLEDESQDEDERGEEEDESPDEDERGEEEDESPDEDERGEEEAIYEDSNLPSDVELDEDSDSELEL